MTLVLEAEVDDAVVFVEAVLAAIGSVSADLRPERVHLVRVKNWFDSKWLWFSGVGRALSDGLSTEHPDTEVEEFRQEEVTFPPFAPGRILSESLWLRSGQTYERPLDFRPIHEKERRQSARNLQRRIRDAGDSALYLWYSSNTGLNGQGSVMAYSVLDGRVVGWYIALVERPHRWAVAKISGSVSPDLRTAISTVLDRRADPQRGAEASGPGTT